MFENNLLKEHAWKKTGLLLSNRVSDKDVRALCKYIQDLTDAETEIYVNLAQDYYDRKTLTKSSRYKISPNAVKLCLKLAKEGYKTFPYIEKLATKGWSTSGGTYSFSMPLLDSSVTSSEIFSFGPIEKLVKKDAVLDIGTSYYGALEVDFK